MNSTITYTPVYVGLAASLWLALLCNLFLDALYGIFALEIFIWSPLIALTSWMGWAQRRRPWARGPGIRKAFLVLAFVALLFVFLPIWFLPRGIVYFIVAIQLASNTQALTRKTLYYGLVIAASIVIFASGHMRATWAMLFYILPFVVAAVFTLVAEQVSRQATEFRARSVGKTAAGREWIAIFSASMAILIVAAFLYAMVPQISWRNAEWSFGLPAAGNRTPVKAEVASTGSVGQGAAKGGGRQGESIWRSPEELRAMAALTWMPRWQALAMAKLADFTQVVQEWWQPKEQQLRKLIDALKEQILMRIADILLLIAAIALIAGILVYIREIRPLLWLRTRTDYLRFGWLGWRPHGTFPEILLYRALERLGDCCGEPRPATSNSGEYLHRLRIGRGNIRADLALLTLAFEGARYGSGSRPTDWKKLRSAYRRIYQRMTD